MILGMQSYSYLSIFIFTALGGYFIPLPEEVIVLLAGYVAAYLSLNVYAVAIVAIIAILIGDNLLFLLSSKSTILMKKLKSKVTSKKLEKYRNFMQKHSGLAIFAMRFVVGLRFFSPLLAGSFHVRWKKFFFYDLMALFIYVSFIIFLGYNFHNSLDFLISRLEFTQHIIFAAILLTGGYLIMHFHKKAVKRYNLD